jgi:hypothetical protein
VKRYGSIPGAHGSYVSVRSKHGRITPMRHGYRIMVTVTDRDSRDPEIHRSQPDRANQMQPQHHEIMTRDIIECASTPQSVSITAS